MPDEPVQPGRVLADRYRLEERLGEGGMGAIWRAEHLVLAAPVAVKILERDVVDSEEAVARFLREAKAAASLRSPHVVQILDYGVEEGVPFIVMELLEGETLRDRIKRLHTLEAVEMVRIVGDVARAITRAHEAGIVHRDLKPENIFLVPNEDSEIAKVLDFGVAKVEASTLADGTNTRTGSILGTPFYMSPEQAQGNKEVDYRSDLWSLGVIAFECLTGKRPFNSDALGDLVLQICVRDIAVPSELATVPAGFDEWFARATARPPEDRFQSAREMIESLRECLGDDYRLTVTDSADDEQDDSASPDRSEEENEEDAESTPADGSDSDEIPAPIEAALDATVLAPAVGPEGEQADRGYLADGAPPARGLLYQVGALALVLGLLGGGIWGVASWQKEKPLPEVQVDEPPPEPSASASPSSQPSANGDAAPAPVVQEDAGEPDAASPADAAAVDARVADAATADAATAPATSAEPVRDWGPTGPPPELPPLEVPPSPEERETDEAYPP
jgi:serine/threonine protein kinase